MLYRFVRDLGVSTKHTKRNFQKVSIDIELSRHEGRTDIEIRHPGKFHIIVECKISKNRIKEQRGKYLGCFQDEPKRILCFITQERDSNCEVTAGVDIRYKGWLDIIGLVEQQDFDRSPVVQEFVSYATKGFKMRDQREILIQDVSEANEIQRYNEHFVYRRDVTFGSPLYFAPYFTKGSGEKVGITRLSKVLGVLTIKPNDIENFKDELLSFANFDASLVEKWSTCGDSNNSDTSYTYYFLAAPVKLNRPLTKDKGIKKGRG
jgi:hypothetical protein